jgi:hypothetical protein
VGDVDAVVALVAPRPLLLVSATEDPYSADAPDIVRAAAPAWAAQGAPDALELARYAGAHPLTAERFNRIVAWDTAHAAPAS